METSDEILNIIEKVLRDERRKAFLNAKYHKDNGDKYHYAHFFNGKVREVIKIQRLVNKLRHFRVENIKHKSYCCGAPIYYRIFEFPDGSYSKEPVCSKCGKFPEASPHAIRKVKRMLDRGELFGKKD